MRSRLVRAGGHNMQRLSPSSSPRCLKPWDASFIPATHIARTVFGSPFLQIFPLRMAYCTGGFCNTKTRQQEQTKGWAMPWQVTSLKSWTTVMLDFSPRSFTVIPLPSPHCRRRNSWTGSSCWARRCCSVSCWRKHLVSLAASFPESTCLCTCDRQHSQPTVLA